MTILTDYAKDRQAAYREHRRQWALAHERPYREDGGKGMGRALDPERMKLDTSRKSGV